MLQDGDVLIGVCALAPAAMVAHPLAVRRDKGVVVVRAQARELREVPLIPGGRGPIVQVCNLPACARSRWSSCMHGH